MGRREGKKPLERPRLRWEDNIKSACSRSVTMGRDWIDVAQDGDRWPALVNAVMNLWVLDFKLSPYSKCCMLSFG
jgi:hypothetical protein